MELPGEAQRAVDALDRVRQRVAAQRGALLPGQGAVLVDQFGRGADYVGDDGVEAAVDLVLRGVCNGQQPIE
ncbi:hypothetical protein ACFVXH_30790 [Kitasatospora sp. NPDC058184]|uniref:hypothetical protein n=1 Tax=Kitasatospora sp. NPDC058184 TaxID=3346370 RepID=UPI0036DDE523